MRGAHEMPEEITISLSYMEKLIITAAICGAEVLKEHNPAVPYTVEECVREAKSAYNAGASLSIFTYVRMTVRLLRVRSVSG